MKTYLLVALYALSDAHAEDYSERLNRLKNVSSEVDRRMRALGIPLPISSNGSTGEESKSKPQLFTIHNSETEQKAPSGKLLFGTLYNRLIVGSEPSPVIVELSEGQGTFSGLRVIGLARQSSTTERVQIEINKLVLMNGKAIALNAVALDEYGASGLKAAVFSSKAWQLAGAMGASFISGLAATSQSTETGSFGYTSVPPTGRNVLLGGLAQTAADQSKRLIDDATKEKPILVVENGSSVSVFLNEEIKF